MYYVFEKWIFVLGRCKRNSKPMMNFYIESFNWLLCKINGGRFSYYETITFLKKNHTYLCQKRKNTPLHFLELLNRIIKFLCHIVLEPSLNFSFQFLNSYIAYHDYCRLYQNIQHSMAEGWYLQDLPSKLENKVSWHSLKKQ